MFKGIKLFTSREHRPAEPLRPLPVFTDIHAHLVPGIDDGARDVDHGADLATELEALGIQKIILTPHVTDEVFPNNPSTVDPPFAELRRELQNRGSKLQLRVSGEYRIDDQLYDQLKAGLVRPMPGDYLLIECGWVSEPFRLEAFVNELVRTYGFKPILAHPERYPYYQREPSNYLRLRRMGLRFQINLLSLSGFYGKQVRDLAKEMLDKNMVEFVGTDLHNHKHLQSITEYMGTREYDFLLRNDSKLLNDKIFGDA